MNNYLFNATKLIWIMSSVVFMRMFKIDICKAPGEPLYLTYQRNSKPSYPHLHICSAITSGGDAYLRLVIIHRAYLIIVLAYSTC